MHTHTSVGVSLLSHLCFKDDDDTKKESADWEGIRLSTSCRDRAVFIGTSIPDVLFNEDKADVFGLPEESFTASFKQTHQLIVNYPATRGTKTLVKVIPQH